MVRILSLSFDARWNIMAVSVMLNFSLYTSRNIFMNYRKAILLNGLIFMTSFSYSMTDLEKQQALQVICAINAQAHNQATAIKLESIQSPTSAFTASMISDAEKKSIKKEKATTILSPDFMRMSFYDCNMDFSMSESMFRSMSSLCKDNRGRVLSDDCIGAFVLTEYRSSSRRE